MKVEVATLHRQVFSSETGIGIFQQHYHILLTSILLYDLPIPYLPKTNLQTRPYSTILQNPSKFLHLQLHHLKPVHDMYNRTELDFVQWRIYRIVPRSHHRVNLAQLGCVRRPEGEERCFWEVLLQFLRIKVRLYLWYLADNKEDR